MDFDTVKDSYQKGLEAKGVPTSLANATAQILAEETQSCYLNKPAPIRTEEQQHIVSSAWEWAKAKGHFWKNS